MNYKFNLLLFSIILLSFSANCQEIGWGFNELTRLKGENYEKKTTDDGDLMVTYITPKYLDGKILKDGYSEIYVLKSTSDKVYKYYAFGVLKLTEFSDLVERNNTKYDKIELAPDQKFFKWINKRENAEYRLYNKGNMGESCMVYYTCTLIQ